MTSGSKSVLFGIRSISSRAVVVFPAPNAPLIQTTVTVPPLLLAPCGLPVPPCHGNQPQLRAHIRRRRCPLRRGTGAVRFRPVSAVLSQGTLVDGEAAVADEVVHGTHGVLDV